MLKLAATTLMLSAAGEASPGQARQAPRAPLSEPVARLSCSAEFAAAVDRLLGHCRRQGLGLAVLWLSAEQAGALDGQEHPELASMLLADCAQRLRGRIRSTDQLFRVGEHEFGVVLPGASAAAARLVGTRLVAAGDGPYRLGEQLLVMRLQCGPAVTAEAGDDGTVLAHRAVALQRGEPI